MSEHNTLSPTVRPLPQYLPAEFDPNNPYGQTQEPSMAEVQLREYLRIAYKYRMVIAATAGLCTLLALIYAFVATPLYTAKSTMKIGTYEPVLTSTKIEDLLQEKSKETNYLETQIQELKSSSLADKVLEQPEIKSALFDTANQGFFGQLFGGDSESKQESDKLDQLAGYKSTVRQIKVYLSTIEIKPVRRTSLVTVEATVSDPRLAALIANRHSESYIDWVRQNRIDQQARGLTFLRAQADELREKVADLERELADYAEANSIVAVNKDENITAQKMSQLNRLLTDATAKRIEAENLYKEAEAALSNPSAGFDDPSTQHMRGELAKLEAEYQQLSAKFTSSYPRMVQLKAQISGLKQSIEGQRRQVVTGLKAKMLAAQQEEKNLHEELEQQKSQAFELSKRQVQFNVLNRELTSSRELLQNVLRQIKETSLAVESNASNVSIVDYAVTPIEPSFPRKKLILLLGMIVGVGLGVGVALLFNYMDSSIRTPEDVMHLLKLPSLGVVPSFELEALGPPGSAPGAGSAAESNGASWKGSKDGGVGQDIVPLAQAVSDLPIVFVNNPRSLASEAYRTIRTGILLSQAGEPPRTMLVSSAQSAEGKTTTSINLAASLASAGGRVILVDADLRRPSVEKHLNMQRTDLGLVDVITGQRTLEEVIIPDVIKRVSVIPSGKIPPNPAELLGSRDMLEIIGQLARMYDYVLIDSPPVLPVTDSVILSRFVDGVVLVVRGATTPRKVVADAKRRLQSVGARFLGVILNDVNVSGGDYYYYNRYYYSYYTEDNQKRAKRPKQAAAG